MLEHGAKVNKANDKGLTALHIVFTVANIDKGSIIAKLRVLLACPKVDLEARESYGMTPLHMAVVHGDTSAVQLLLQNGANVNAADEIGETALDISLSAENKESVVPKLRILLSWPRVNKEIRDKIGMTPLHMAV